MQRVTGGSTSAELLHRHLLPSCGGDRYRHGEPITSSFVESAVNQVVSKRFVKRQQVAWRPALAQGLLQVRTSVLNEQLRSCFKRWYPTLAGNDRTHHLAA